MDKKIAGLLGAAAALTAVNSAQAAAPASTALEPAATYSDLLEAIPNALALLKTEDTKGTDTRANGQTRLAQHHHHHRYYRRYHHHHHRYYHHHHHHHRD
jgi:hypothetical protein